MIARFSVPGSLLSTTGMAFLKLNWLNQPAINFICAKCGRIEWFYPTKELDPGREI